MGKWNNKGNNIQHEQEVKNKYMKDVQSVMCAGPVWNMVGECHEYVDVMA